MSEEFCSPKSILFEFAPVMSPPLTVKSWVRVTLPELFILNASIFVPLFLTKKFSPPCDQPLFVPTDSLIAMMPARSTALPAPFSSRDTNARPTVEFCEPSLLYKVSAGLKPLVPVALLSCLTISDGVKSPGFLYVAPSH